MDGLRDSGAGSQLVFRAVPGSPAVAELFVGLSLDPESGESIVLTATGTGLRTEFYGADGQVFAETFRSYDRLVLDALGNT